MKNRNISIDIFVNQINFRNKSMLSTWVIQFSILDPQYILLIIEGMGYKSR